MEVVADIFVQRLEWRVRCNGQRAGRIPVPGIMSMFEVVCMRCDPVACVAMCVCEYSTPSEQGFHGKVNADSTAKRTGFPRHCEQEFEAAADARGGPERTARAGGNRVGRARWWKVAAYVARM